MNIRDVQLRIPDYYVLASIPVLLFVFNIIAGFNGLYGQDSFEYLRYSRVLHEYLEGGPMPGTFYWPILYPLSGALVSFFFPDYLALQAISIFCFAVTSVLLWKILLRLYPDKKREMNLYLALFFSLSPFVMRCASVDMSDSLAMMFLSATLYHYLLYRENGTNRNFILMALFAAASVNTRYAAAAVILVPALDAALRFFGKFHAPSFLVALLCILAVFLPNIFLGLQGSPALTGPILIPDWSFMNFFHRSFSTSDGNLSYTLPNIIYVFSNLFHPGYIFAGVLFAFFPDRQFFKNRFLKAILVTILVYALFLAGFATQNLRFLLLTFPCVIIIFSPPFLRIWDYISKRGKWIKTLAVIMVFLAQLALFYRAYRPFYENNRMVREIAEKMKSYPGKTIYTFSIDMGLQAYGIKNDIINLWSEKVDHYKPGSLFLFNYEDTYRQWKNLNPMINWDKVNRENDMVLIEKLPGNWNLYEIRN